MAVQRLVVDKVDNFDRAQTITTTPTGEWGWTLTKTAAAGSPTLACVSEDDGALNFTLAATSEAEILDLTSNDILPFRWDKVNFVRFTLMQPVAANAVTTLFFGLTGARNDVVGSITEKTIFKVLGSASTTNVVIDTSDGVNTSTSIATGKTIGTTYVEYLIDFTKGLSDVRFFIDGAPVARTTTFLMSGITAGDRCQVNVQLQKASGTGVPQLQLSRVAIQYKTADGA